MIRYKESLGTYTTHTYRHAAWSTCLPSPIPFLSALSLLTWTKPAFYSAHPCHISGSQALWLLRSWFPPSLLSWLQEYLLWSTCIWQVAPKTSRLPQKHRIKDVNTIPCCKKKVPCPDSLTGEFYKYQKVDNSCITWVIPGAKKKKKEKEQRKAAQLNLDSKSGWEYWKRITSNLRNTYWNLNDRKHISISLIKPGKLGTSKPGEHVGKWKS